MNVGTEKHRPIVSKRLVKGKRELVPHYRRWSNMKASCYGSSYHNKWYLDGSGSHCKKCNTIVARKYRDKNASNIR